MKPEQIEQKLLELGATREKYDFRDDDDYYLDLKISELISYVYEPDTNVGYFYYEGGEIDTLDMKEVERTLNFFKLKEKKEMEKLDDEDEIMSMLVGYASAYESKRLPIDEIKLDTAVSFIMDFILNNRNEKAEILTEILNKWDDAAIDKWYGMQHSNSGVRSSLKKLRDEILNPE
jgi:hypothetical protein